MSETNCHIDCVKQTQFLHVKLLVKTIQLHTELICSHTHFDTTCITKSKSSILVVRNNIIHTLFLHNLFLYHKLKIHNKVIHDHASMAL